MVRFRTNFQPSVQQGLGLLLIAAAATGVLAAAMATAASAAEDGPGVGSRSGVIAVYHHVAEHTPPSTSISPAQFRRHLEYLRDGGFTVLRLDEMIEALRAGRNLPQRAVAITFDDGYGSIYDTAFPMLVEFGMPFAVFISSGPADAGQGSYMNWEQIRELAAAGVLIANHSVSHAHLLQLTLAEAQQEVLQAEARIAEETGQSHRYLAYPYGEYKPALQAWLAEAGYTGFAQHSGAVGPDSDFLALPRFPLAGIYANLDTAKVKLASLALSVERLEPESPVTNLQQPSLQLQFRNAENMRDALQRLNCFFNNRPLPVQWIDRAAGILELAPSAETHSQPRSRRWNYVCTARAENSDRYYWYSVPWFNPSVPE